MVTFDKHKQIILEKFVLMEKFKINTQAIEKFWRTTNYLCVSMLYLKDNVLLKQPLKSEHFKEQIVGHWGSCPGINAIYAQINDLMRRTGQPI
ncbi:MAG: hypothetical protein F6K24_34600 [Okeania sp. SIO2D1]|nr:hypothetical protein [Okeania sp. SIO2D1]